MEISFDTPADLDAMADLLGELFGLESEFAPQRDKQRAALRSYQSPGFEESAMVVRRKLFGQDKLPSIRLILIHAGVAFGGRHMRQDA